MKAFIDFIKIVISIIKTKHTLGIYVRHQSQLIQGNRQHGGPVWREEGGAHNPHLTYPHPQHPRPQLHRKVI